MTRKERAVRNLKQMCSNGRYLGSGSYAPLEVLEDFNLAIKALEQEPTHMVDKSNFRQEQYKADLKCAYDCGKSILDKIRAEIEQLPTSRCSETYRMDIYADDFKENVLAIFDKYRAESEE